VSVATFGAERAVALAVATNAPPAGAGASIRRQATEARPSRER